MQPAGLVNDRLGGQRAAAAVNVQFDKSMSWSGYCTFCSIQDTQTLKYTVCADTYFLKVSISKSKSCLFTCFDIFSSRLC